MLLYLLVPTAYVLGSIPVAYLIGKRYAIDITSAGSKNVGTVNVWRSLGWRPGLAALAFDVGKGIFVMALALGLGLNEWLAFSLAMAVTIGHNFSVFLGFKGGKGAAVVFGLSLVILPVLTLLAVISLPIVFYLTRSIVWSFFIGLVVLNVLTVTTAQPAAQIALCFSLSLVVVATHLWRIRRDLLPTIRSLDFARFGHIE